MNDGKRIETLLETVRHHADHLSDYLETEVHERMMAGEPHEQIKADMNEVLEIRNRAEGRLAALRERINKSDEKDE